MKIDTALFYAVPTANTSSFTFVHYFTTFNEMCFMSDENELPEKFSDDEEEHLRIENEILKLKLQAELGAEMQSLEGSENLSPELENLFLKNILSFEQQFESGETISVYELLDKPAFTNINELDEDGIAEALENLETLMREKNIAVDYALDYTDWEKYRFITQDLFAHKTMPVNLPGMVIHFSYEEFYPNHKLIIEETAKEFIEHWFERDFTEDSYELANEFILKDKSVLSKQDVLNKFDIIFASYKGFEECEYEITNIVFQLHADNNTGTGFAEGTVTYNALLENNETVAIEGSFKLDMVLMDGYWTICFFQWPSFQW